jgi:predicted NAD-dependent protein-ADP-ribosyltransferase YbiA (DUF1768 family)
MVSSRINSNVTFKEHRTIDMEDRGHQSSLYDLNIWGKNIVIALGKPKFTFSNYNILYYPIYLISLNNTIEGCIGVFETKMSDPKSGSLNLDEEGDIDINKMGNPIFFDFAEKIVDRTKTSVEAYLERAVTSFVPLSNDDKNENHMEEEDTEEKDTDEEDTDEEDILKLPIKLNKIPNNQDNLFIINKKVAQLPILQEETEDIANTIKTNFKPSSRNNWVQTFLKNSNYDIHTIPGDGNCFFSTVIEAFAQIGRITTIEKLRKLLADEVTDEIYQEYMTVYRALHGQIKNFDKDLQQIKKTIEQDLKARSLKTTNIKDIEILKNEVNSLKTNYSDLLAQKNQTQNLLYSIVGDLSKIDTFEQFKEYIQSPNYWADAWAISTIESKLNIKIIILNEESFNQNDLNNVLNCGEINKSLQEKQIFTPDYYIITTYSGNHYQNVSYLGKKILKYSEIPYHIKILVIKRCLERNSGVYYLINEFRDLKVKLGIEADEGNPQANKEEEDHIEISGNDNMYDPTIVFMFYSKSNKKPFPGNGSHEEIPKEKSGEFSKLATIDEWRKKLDDSWNNAKFTIDGKEYGSVEHYYQSSKFKNSHPDFANLFSLNSDSPISKDVDLCQGAGSKNGKYKKEQIRPKNYKIDPDFYPTRNKEERKRALHAKFTQNIDMKQILLYTKHAKLVQYVSGENRKTDIELMEIRRDIMQQSNT